MTALNPLVESYFRDGCGRCHLYKSPECKVHSWNSELRLLRNIVIETGLKEDYKWSQPCYTFDGKNILILSAFKESALLSFFKGVLLKDEKELLEKPGKYSQSSRFFRFYNTQQIETLTPFIHSYILEAIENEKAGKKVVFQKNPEPIPDELIEKFEEDPIFKMAFNSLTPGRQRGYIINFSAPKQSKTRKARIEKYYQTIIDGKGMHDDYRRSMKK